MKRKHIFILCACAVALLSCEMDVSDSTLDFTVSRVRSEQVWVEIFPQSNDFYYIYDAVPVEEYNSFRNDRRFIEHHFEEMEEMCKSLNNILKEYGYATMPIEQMLFYNGAVDGTLPNLQPNTDYYAFAYCLNSRKRPIHKLIKRPFTTPAKPNSDITFDVRMTDNRTLTVFPSNSDTYLWTIESKASVLDYYQLGAQDSVVASVMLPIWFAGELNTIYQWDFQLYTSGRTDVDLSEQVTQLADGDVFYFGCVGYTTEETTDESLYQVTYHTLKPSMVEKIESTLDDPAPENNDESVSPALNLLRRNPERFPQMLHSPARRSM